MNGRPQKHNMKQSTLSVDNGEYVYPSCEQCFMKVDKLGIHVSPHLITRDMYVTNTSYGVIYEDQRVPLHFLTRSHYCVDGII